MGVREDTWLSERFGHPVFTVDDPAALAELHSPASYQARVDVTEVDRLERLEAAGMRVVNTTVTLVADAPRAPACERCEVRPADRDRDGGLPGLAERVFRYDRFHLDPQVPAAVADRIKRDWVASYLSGQRGDELLVAEHDGQALGFLCVLVREGAHVVDLIGVAPEARGRGIGRSLMAALHEHAAGGIRVGTQLANLPALRFYAGLGYVPVSSAYDLHLHT